MTVGELEEILAMLPRDTAVTISTGGPCRHVDFITKMGASRKRDSWPGCLDPVPAIITLRASSETPLWYQAYGDDVDFTMWGRWPTKFRRRPGGGRLEAAK